MVMPVCSRERATHERGDPGLCARGVGGGGQVSLPTGARSGRPIRFYGVDLQTGLPGCAQHDRKCVYTLVLLSCTH